MHVSPYIYRGPTNLRVWEERHPKTQDLIAIKHYHSTYEQTRTIWMDGRPHPGPNAAHTWMGFSTGRYDGDMLVVETTHLKQGWIRRNGVADERPGDHDRVLHAHRRHVHAGRRCSSIRSISPSRSSRARSSIRSTRELPAQTWLWVCDPVVEIATREDGEVPAYLPGEHPFKDEFARRHQLPEIASAAAPRRCIRSFRKC